MDLGRISARGVDRVIRLSWTVADLAGVKRPGAAEVLDTNQKQRIIAMVCSDPPEGRARWTVRLVAEEAVKRKLVPNVGRETIRILLLHHDLKPWREKNVVRGGPRR